MPKLTGQKLVMDLPTGWDGRIFRRELDPSSAQKGGKTRAALHAGNFPLPAEIADFGNGAVERMGAGHVLLTLTEYGPESVATALFAHDGVPSLTVDKFNPNTLLRLIPGQAGSQSFFHVEGRAFCLYVVIGAYNDRARLVPQARAVVDTLEVGA